MNIAFIRILTASSSVFVATCSMNATALERPMTFQIRSKVESVFYHPMFDGDIDIEVGGRMTAQFTFMPDGGDGGNFLSLVQEFSSSITIAGNAWATPEIRLQAFDDHYDPGPEGKLRVITDVVPDGVTPIRGPFDILQVGSDRLSLANAIENSSDSGTQLNFWTLQLLNTSLASSGAGEIALPLDQAQVPYDVAVWNSFAERSLTVSLLDRSGRGATVYATVGDFRVVPEPTSICQAFSCILACVFAPKRSIRRKIRHT